MTHAPETEDVTAIVLCGGTSRRFGGGDKTTAQVDGESILNRLLLGLPDRWTVICVGTPRPTARPVIWTREDPPGSGPLAGIAAGIAESRTRYTVVLAGDQPFAAEAVRDLVTALAAADDGLHDRYTAAQNTPEKHVDGVQALDTAGEHQPLLAAYRTQALRAVLPVDARNRGVRRVLAPLHCTGLDVAGHTTWDVDTTEDLARAQQHVRGT
ncbi:molybdenum cofactor guanylyltransferase [Austwickia chelonae]|uniref:molybdenum cofactor guanylyltransferase n=1 Tax=Austwickia chelonae TaxID=100225 RepID=UPI0013C37B11|nr:NTP transferase domain-containing protein [Austwickia chelonae]